MGLGSKKASLACNTLRYDWIETMRVFVVADTHFADLSLASIYQSRPHNFQERIIQNWQSVIRDEDLVIHLGDVLVGRSAEWSTVIPALPGRKILVAGNHDKKSLSWYMTNGFQFCCSEFSWRMFGIQILFSHEPTEDGLFDLNIHGHLHLGKHREHKSDECHYLISLEQTHYQPRTLKSIVEAWAKSRQS